MRTNKGQTLTLWRSHDEKIQGRADMCRGRKCLLGKVEWEQSCKPGKSRCQIPVVGGSVAILQTQGGLLVGAVGVHCLKDPGR